MKKVVLIVLALFLTVAMVITAVSPALACSMGLTPGYWKNHAEVWSGAALGGAYYDKVFGLTKSFTTPPTVKNPTGIVVNLHITLFEALTSMGNSNGVNAFLRESAAALLNSVYLTDYGSPRDTKATVQAAFNQISTADWDNYASFRGVAKGDIEGWKNYLSAWNSLEHAVFRSSPAFPLPWSY